MNSFCGKRKRAVQMGTDNTVRCSLTAAGYAKVLCGMNLPEETVEQTKEIFREIPQLTDIFVNPTIPLKNKLNVIDKVFPQEIRNFLKTACRYRRLDLTGEIFAAYDRYRDEQRKILRAVLTCTTPPDRRQLEGMERFLCKKYGVDKARIEVHTDDSLLGGFILRAGSDEYDWSIKGRLNRLEQTLTWR